MILARLAKNGQLVSLKSEGVYDQTSGQTVAAFIAKMEAFKLTVDTFLTGEANQDEVIDRLSELVAAIKANRDLINTTVNGSLKLTDIVNDLTTGGTDKVLSAEQGKELKALIDAIPTFENVEVLDGIGQDADGDLTYNGKTLNGETGIAFGASLETATDYTGKLQIVIEEIEESA